MAARWKTYGEKTPMDEVNEEQVITYCLHELELIKPITRESQSYNAWKEKYKESTELDDIFSDNALYHRSGWEEGVKWADSNKIYNTPLYDKNQRSSFSYWFAHWCAVNMTAVMLKVWTPRFLFHDILKPFHMWWCKDYSKVQKYHRTHSKHHLEYKGDREKIDWIMMICDWQASQLTKKSCPRNARQETYRLIKENGNYIWTHELETKVLPLLRELGL